MVINNPYYIKTEIKKEKPVGIVYELKDEYKIPSFEEFMKDYEVDEKVENSYTNELGSYRDIRVEKKFGPMPFYRDVVRCTINFQGANYYLYKGIFRHENGTVSKQLSFRGVDEMKKTLQELEEEKIKVYREEVNGDEIKFKRLKFREEETKETLKEWIRKWENDYSWVESELLEVHIGGKMYQV